jgi:hypothetical protein
MAAVALMAQSVVPITTESPKLAKSPMMMSPMMMRHRPLDGVLDPSSDAPSRARNAGQAHLEKGKKGPRREGIPWLPGNQGSNKDVLRV